MYWEINNKQVKFRKKEKKKEIRKEKEKKNQKHKTKLQVVATNI